MTRHGSVGRVRSSGSVIASDCARHQSALRCSSAIVLQWGWRHVAAMAKRELRPGINDLAANESTQMLVSPRRIVVAQDAHQHLMRWGSLAAEMPKAAVRELVTPNVGAQKCSRRGPAYSPGLIAHVQAPQHAHRHHSGIRRVPAPPNDDGIVAGGSAGRRLAPLIWLDCHDRHPRRWPSSFASDRASAAPPTTRFQVVGR